MEGCKSVKNARLFPAVILLGASTVLFAQSTSLGSSYLDSDAVPGGGHSSVAPVTEIPNSSGHAFSKMALGTGISPMGIQVSLTTNLNSHLNVRPWGSFFNYSTNFTASGIGANASLNMTSSGTALDFYPFRLGFRISPGVLFYNGNQISATANVPGGTSFTLNGQTYYSASANQTTGAVPVNGNALLSLHTTNPAFTVTTGWGNTLPRKGHWSFPFELGAAFTGAPTVKVNLAGWACYDQAQTMCTDISSTTNPIALEIQSNLASQVTKWTKDLEPLKTYPIATFGVAYSFGLRNK